MSEISGALSVLAESGQLAPDFERGFRTFQSPPTVVGQIKTNPEDFYVAEKLAFEPVGEGEHIYLYLEKSNTNTGWLAHQLAQYLDTEDQNIGFAGRKDRHAVTRQWFSCYYPGKTASWDDFAEEGVSLLSETRHRSKLRRGEIAYNEFRLRIPFVGDAAEVNERLEVLNQSGFPNYFGLQRFGNEGQNLTKADRLLRPAGRAKERFKARGMLISAARSWLFNLYLSDQMSLQLSDQSSNQSWADGVGPLIGKSRDPQPGEASLGEVEQAWVAGLRKLGAKAATRPLWAKADELAWEFGAGEVQLAFKLPTGSYATSLLREIFIVEDKAK
ncbi:MAG: tRNA pseudouridine13 synthase [Candidatus Azotimanducaceae bacterium]